MVLISANGVTFEKVAEVAALSPVPDGRYFATFTLLGVYVGVIPVLMGLLWYPFLRRLTDRWLNFFLSFTVGLLLFLGVDAVDESLDFAGEVAAAFQGVALVAAGIVLAFLAVSAVDRSRKVVAGAAGASTLVLVYSIAVGIGLHNPGEGLAIGAAYTGGSIALGTMLVVGFAAETENVAQQAAAKRKTKGCDWILANDVSHNTGIFGGDENTVQLIDGEGAEDWPTMTKLQVAECLARRIACYFSHAA